MKSMFSNVLNIYFETYSRYSNYRYSNEEERYAFLGIVVSPNMVAANS